MASSAERGDSACSRAASPSRRSRWVLAVSREQERRLYFAAMVLLVVWYLLDRLLG